MFYRTERSFYQCVKSKVFCGAKSGVQAYRLKRGVTIGANATIVCGVTLGEYAFVGAGAVVAADVAPHAIVVGVPAKQIGWMSAYGEKLIFDDSGSAVCPGSGKEYQLTNGLVKEVIK